MTFKMVTFNSTLRDLEISNSRSRICQHPISHYWMELGLRFLLNTDRKSYMTFKMVTFNLTLKGQAQGHGYFNVLYLTIGWSKALGF